MQVGELKAQVAALQAGIASLTAQVAALSSPAPVVASPIPTKVALAIRGLAGKDQSLARHLTEEAAGLMGFAHMDEDQVVTALVTGTRH